MKYSLCLCLFLLLNFSPSFQQSACESVENPTGLSSCKGKTTSSNTETCCYSKYNDMDGDGTECIEINSEDAETNEKLESTLFSIIDGDYWEDYTNFYNSLNVDCGNGLFMLMKIMNVVMYFLMTILLVKESQLYQILILVVMLIVMMMKNHV